MRRGVSTPEISVPAGHAATRPDPASMRPGRFHPGNEVVARNVRAHRARFNEAGAFPPRKCRQQAMQNNKTMQASMRPGRFHPGNGTSAAGGV